MRTPRLAAYYCPFVVSKPRTRNKTRNLTPKAQNIFVFRIPVTLSGEQVQLYTVKRHSNEHIYVYVLCGVVYSPYE